MDTTFDTTVVMVLTVLMLPLIGIMVTATPYLMPRGEVFAVTVPTTERRDPYVRKLKRCYALALSSATLVLTGAALACACLGIIEATMAIVVGGAVVLGGGSYLLMLLLRAKMIRYKRKRGWVPEVQESVAIAGGGQVRGAVSLKWNVWYVPVIALTLAVGAAGYAQMPDTIPVHAGFDGVVNGWVDKSPLILLVPVLIQSFMALCLVFSHWSIIRSKKWADPGAPATSALAYGLFARAQSICLVVGGLAICVTMMALPLSFMNLITLMQASMFVIGAAFVLCIGMIVVSVVYGQAGSRVFRRMSESDKLRVDDDAYWKCGVLYFNPDDASLFLPKRFGVGWTVNWARPAVWIIVVGFFALTAAVVVAASVLS